MLLRLAMEDLKPLLISAFPANWEAIYALSMIRTDGNVPLKQSKTIWEKLHNPDSIMPNMNPGAVSKLLRTVGIDREGQDILFQGILDHSEQLIYDLSTTVSRSMSILQAEKGYNKDKIHLPQINPALLCSADTGFPTMIRSVNGSVKDIKTLSNTIKEMDLEGKLLVLDRNFFSEDVIKDLSEAKIDYVLPTRRNSHYYDVRIIASSKSAFRLIFLRTIVSPPMSPATNSSSSFSFIFCRRRLGSCTLPLSSIFASGIFLFTHFPHYCHK